MVLNLTGSVSRMFLERDRVEGTDRAQGQLFLKGRRPAPWSQCFAVVIDELS